MKKIFIVLMLLAIMLGACAPETSTPEVVYVEITSTPEPTEVPTDTPEPTNTSIPTNTPEPTLVKERCDVTLDDLERQFNIDITRNNEFNNYNYSGKKMLNQNVMMIMTANLNDSECVYEASIGYVVNVNNYTDADITYIVNSYDVFATMLDPDNKDVGLDFVFSCMENCGVESREWGKDFLGTRWEFGCGADGEFVFMLVEIFTNSGMNS